MPDTSKMSEADARAVFQHGFSQLHACLEDHRTETRGAFKAVTETLGELASKLDISNAYNAAQAKRMGVVEKDGSIPSVEKVKVAVGAWSLRKAVTVIGTWGTLILVLLGIVGPPFVNFLHESWERLLAYVFH